MNKDITYKKKNILTIVEVDYSDNTLLFELEGIDEDGTTWSSGMYNLEDLLVNILFKVGKIKETTTYNLNYPEKECEDCRLSKIAIKNV